MESALNAAPQFAQMQRALALAEEYGIPVFPLNRWKFDDGERVYCKAPLTKNGFYDATTNAEQISAWWKRYPDALIGVPTGAASKLFVIDVDPEGLADYAENAAFFGPGRVQKTARGFHLIYNHPGDLGCTGKKWRAGYDTRGDGGYIVWWESEGFHCTGSMADVGPLPELVLASLRRYESQRVKVRARDPNGGIGPDRSKDLLRRVGLDVRNGLADYEIHARHEGHPHVIDQADGPRAIQRCIDLVRSSQPPERATVTQMPERGAPGASTSMIQGTDLALGRRLHERHGANLRFTVERGWLVWSGRHWQIDDKSLAVADCAKESAESMFDEIRDATDQKEAFKLAKLAAQKRAIEAAIWLERSERGVPARLIDFDVDPMILNVRNGIVDLTTGELLPHDKTKLCTMLAGTDFDASATCHRWRQFIGEITGENVPLMDYIQTLCGYLLTASVAEHCMAFFYGLGRNGKSVFQDTIYELMGDYACSSNPELIMARKHQGIPNDVARLRGKRAVFLNETERGGRFDEAKLKQLTGGDVLNARFLREEFFDFAPTHKLVMRGNYQPRITGTDDGIWSRMRLVPFEQSFVGREDRGLKDELLSELPGILNWAIEGCLRWQQEGLVTPQVILDAVTQYRQESDVLGTFMDEECVMGKGHTCKSSVLYRRYREYCDQSAERAMPSKDFPHELEKRGISKTKSHGSMVFQGIDLRQAEMSGGQSWYDRE
jgi:putative DNA primase/helicase